MITTQITVRSISDSPTIEYHIHKYVKRISRIYKNITSCRVVIDTAQRHKHKRKVFSISIDITVPGKELVSRKKNENLYVAIRDGFSAIERLLTKHAKKKTIHVDKYSIYSMIDAIKHSPPTMSTSL